LTAADVSELVRISTCSFEQTRWWLLTLSFRPFCRSSPRRAGLVSFGRLVVDTSGEFSCGNERIIGAAVRSVRAVESLYVTVLGSAAYIGARYLVRVWRGSRRDLTRLRRLL